MEENYPSRLEKNRFSISPESNLQMKQVREIFFFLKEKYPELKALSFYGSRVKGMEKVSDKTSDLDCYLFYNGDELPEEYKKSEDLTQIKEYRGGNLAKDFLEKLNELKIQNKVDYSFSVHLEPIDVSSEKTKKELEWFTMFIRANFWNGPALDSLLVDRMARGLAGRFLLSVGDIYETRKQILKYLDNLPDGQDHLQGLMWVLASIERPKPNQDRSFPPLPEYKYPWTIGQTKERFLKTTKEPAPSNGIEQKDIKIDINKPGTLLHGARIAKLRTILSEGIKIPKEVGGQSHVPNHVSLSMVISNYEGSSAATMFGSGKNRVSLVIDPKYIEQHKDEFLAVGRWLTPTSNEFHTGTRKIEILQKLKVADKENIDLYWDEVLTSALPPDAVIGVICDDPSVFESFKDQLPQRPLVVYDATGAVLYEIK